MLDLSIVEPVPFQKCIQDQAVTRLVTLAEHCTCYLQVLTRTVPTFRLLDDLTAWKLQAKT